MDKKIKIKKSYLVGRNRLESDSFWCSAVAIMLSILNGNNDIGSLMGSFIGVFLFFHLWFWNKEDVKSELARVFIHIVCWIWFILAFFMFCIGLYSLLMSFENGISWYFLLFPIIMTFFVVKKYRHLMF